MYTATDWKGVRNDGKARQNGERKLWRRHALKTKAQKAGRAKHLPATELAKLASLYT